jgi:hypothetical protein
MSVASVTPIALGVIRTDQAGGGVRLQENRMRRWIQENGYTPVIGYHTGPIPPDELAMSVQQVKASVVVATTLGALGTACFKAVRGQADIWLLDPKEAYLQHNRGTTGSGTVVRETIEQAARRIQAELAAEVAKIDDYITAGSMFTITNRGAV